MATLRLEATLSRLQMFDEVRYQQAHAVHCQD